MDVYNHTSLFISLLLILLIEYSSSAVIHCSSADNAKWSINKQKCVQCPKCHPGHFRNLTEPYTRRTGEHGAEQCLLCTPCPTGTFSKSGYGECLKCVINCTDLDRVFDEKCSTLSDAKCGSCLSGFKDIFKDTQYPCAPKPQRSVRLLEPPKKQSGQTDKVTPDENSAIVRVHPEDSLPYDTGRQADDVTDVSSKSSFEKAPSHTPIVAVVIIVCGGMIIPMAGLVTFRIYVRGRSHTEGGNSVMDQPGTYSRTSDLSHDNDIEMDTFAYDDETVQKGYHEVPQIEPEGVRPEIDSPHQPLPRPELSNTPSSNNCDGMIYIGLPDRPSDVLCFEKYKDICRCRTERRCRCKSYMFPSTLKIEKSDKYVLEVAANVCHNPFPFFRYLGLENPLIYQENDTRDRDPERISQKDLVINLLHKWIEVKPAEATLKQLSESLCAADFHDINDKLYNLFNNDINDHK